MDTTEREIIERLAAYLQESHAEEMQNDHFGDGPHGCSYCEALNDAGGDPRQPTAPPPLSAAKEPK